MPIIGEIRSFGFGAEASISTDYEFYQVLRRQGWLECDGKSIPILQFRRLFRVIGHNWGSEDKANTFKLPDLRGLFIRGWNHASEKDPDAGSRVGIHPVDAPGDFGGATADSVGSYQPDELGSHHHSIPFRMRRLAHSTTTDREHLQAGNPPVSTSRTGGNETRPKNAYVMYCIWTGRELPRGELDLSTLDPDIDFET